VSTMQVPRPGPADADRTRDPDSVSTMQVPRPSPADADRTRDPDSVSTMQVPRPGPADADRTRDPDSVSTRRVPRPVGEGVKAGKAEGALGEPLVKASAFRSHRATERSIEREPEPRIEFETGSRAAPEPETENEAELAEPGSRRETQPLAPLDLPEVATGARAGDARSSDTALIGDQPPEGAPDPAATRPVGSAEPGPSRTPTSSTTVRRITRAPRDTQTYPFGIETPPPPGTTAEAIDRAAGVSESLPETGEDTPVDPER
jgi:hypothetical protein